MAKKTVHIDTLGPYDTWRAPWETEGGSDAEIDKVVLKRLIFNLKQTVATGRDSLEDAKETLTETEASLESAKDQAASANGEEAQKKIDRLETKLAEVTSSRDGLIKDAEVSTLRAEVLEGVDAKHAKHVVGDTREELEKSLAEIREDFGIVAPKNDDEEEYEEEEKSQLRTNPRRLKNSGDPAPNEGANGEYDFDKVANDIVTNGALFR